MGWVHGRNFSFYVQIYTPLRNFQFFFTPKPKANFSPTIPPFPFPIFRATQNSLFFFFSNSPKKKKYVLLLWGGEIYLREKKFFFSFRNGNLVFVDFSFGGGGGVIRTPSLWAPPRGQGRGRGGGTLDAVLANIKG